MNLQLSSMAISIPPVQGHPNREPFRGVLTLVDTPSDKAPAGSRGHRVILTRAAAEHALSSLLGMALDYSPSFDRHDARRKVGVITRAEIVGKELELSGYLYAKDFPELVRQIETGVIQAGSGRRAHNPLGMSYEIANASVADTRARIWTLTHVTIQHSANQVAVVPNHFRATSVFSLWNCGLRRTKGSRNAILRRTGTEC
jgi:hypothetical protein